MLRFNVIPVVAQKTTSTPHLCLIYVSCMSYVCQMYPLAAPLLVRFRAPKSPCASRFYVLVRSTVSTKQESDRFDAVARRFACSDVFSWRKKQDPKRKICKNHEKHVLFMEYHSHHFPAFPAGGRAAARAHGHSKSVENMMNA